MIPVRSMAEALTLAGCLWIAMERIQAMRAWVSDWRFRRTLKRGEPRLRLGWKDERGSNLRQHQIRNRPDYRRQP